VGTITEDVGDEPQFVSMQLEAVGPTDHGSQLDIDWWRLFKIA